jgi:hypothetical protein
LPVRAIGGVKMKEVTWMTDYLPVMMLGVAQKAERRFEEILMSCPKDGGTILVDDPKDFTNLLESRVTSLMMSMASLEAYLGYYAYQASKMIEKEDPKITLLEYVNKHHLNEFLDRQPLKIKRRYDQFAMQWNDKSIIAFLNDGQISCEEKILLYPLIRAKQVVDYKDGYIMKVVRLLALKEEILTPSFSVLPELKKVETIEEIHNVFLHHDLVGSVTPGVSSSDEYVVDPYLEGHFMWELVHLYPARAVQEFVQYLHKMDQSENHFIMAMSIVELVDEKGDCLTETLKRYSIELNPGG